MHDKGHLRTLPTKGAERKLFEDEVLETIWEHGERGPVSLRAVVAEIGNEPGLREMESDGFFIIEADAVTFTEKGKMRARDITRRHLLAERLFADVLDLSDYEEEACQWEHAISSEVEEAICTFLGHPPTCPHGRPIPRGECCKLYSKKLRPLVRSLSEVEVGTSGKIVFINSPSIDRLASIGIVPGTEVKLIQKKPSFVLGIDESTIALDEDIAKGIYVKQ